MSPFFPITEHRDRKYHLHKHRWSALNGVECLVRIIHVFRNTYVSYYSIFCKRTFSIFLSLKCGKPWIFMSHHWFHISIILEMYKFCSLLFEGRHSAQHQAPVVMRERTDEYSRLKFISSYAKGWSCFREGSFRLTKTPKFSITLKLYGLCSKNLMYETPYNSCTKLHNIVQNTRYR